MQGWLNSPDLQGLRRGRSEKAGRSRALLRPFPAIPAASGFGESWRWKNLPAPTAPSPIAATGIEVTGMRAASEGSVRRCPHCGSNRIRPSRRKADLGIWKRYRCHDCHRHFLRWAPGRLAWMALAVGVLSLVTLSYWLGRSGPFGAASRANLRAGHSEEATSETPEGFNWQYAAARKWLQSGELDRAIPMLREAARSGHVAAQLELGLAYYWGRGTLQDFVQAVELFQQAAQQGNPEAQYMLGQCYQLGQGVAQDFVLAYAWFNRASARGHAAAIQSRQELSRLLSPEEVTRGQLLSRQLDTNLRFPAPPPEPEPSPR